MSGTKEKIMRFYKTNLQSKRSVQRPIGVPKQPKTSSGSRRQGAAVVEFAVVAPLMIMLTFSLIELGRFSIIKENATHATREGARVGIKPTATLVEVISRANEELDAMGIIGGEVSANFVDGASSGAQSVAVSVEVPIDQNSWVPNFLTVAATHIRGSTTMRRESTN